ncbi:MAG: ABC transporter substrate-binding protein, partial [Thauera sp.]
MKLSKLFATLSAGFVLATGAGLPAAQAATTLNMSSWVSPTQYLTPEVFQPWIEDVKRVTEGRVDVRSLPKPV